ncbi:MAG: hypothetical protein K9L85_00545 [Candidatus Peribacteraceae bacterium]|nr:hypothetical protein [Candidatus Peribacteraceae bacterium]
MNLILSNSREARPGVRRRTLSSKVELGTFALMVVAVLLALAVSLIYLAHANRTATRGYVLKSLEIEKNNLRTQTEIWEQRVSEARSLTAIEKSGILSQMVDVKDPTYLKASLTSAEQLN